MNLSDTNKLLVEGKSDAYALASLFSKHVEWGNQRSEWPVFLEDVIGFGALTNADSLGPDIKSSVVANLGIVIDADESCSSRFHQVLNAVRISLESVGEAELIPDPLPDPDPLGYVVDRANGKKIGVWVMPNNNDDGMLETYLSYLVPLNMRKLYSKCENWVGKSREYGASFTDSHFDKAKLHSYLAVVDEPGCPLGEAVLNNTLNGLDVVVDPLVAWFRRLYSL